MSNDESTDGRPPSAAGAPPRRRGLEGRVIGGRYQVTQTVAAGANTLIADAHDTELDRTVTIKLVRPELSESESFRRRFGRRMDAMAALSHPNLAAVYGWGEERIGKRTTVYVVCEYLSGGSLRDLFDRKRYLTPSQALLVGLEACRGLDFAHRKGLLHTELTPSKLVFGDDRRLRIVDFGLARIIGEQGWKDPSTLPTHVARYASPEQARGEKPNDRSDVYSLALILVEAVTGRTPFQADSTVATLAARVGKLMPVSADLGPLAAVLEHAGRPEPEDRLSASQFGRGLVRAAERMPRPAPLPILTKSLFDDPQVLRRPNDPTGGIVRPADDPAVPVVTASPGVVSPPARRAPDPAPAGPSAPPAPGASVEVTPPAADDASVGTPVAVTPPAADEPAVEREQPVLGPARPDAGDAPAATGTATNDTTTDDTATGHTPVDDPTAAATTDDTTGDTTADDTGDEVAPASPPAGSIDLAALVERTPSGPPAVEPPSAPEGRAARKAAKARARAEAREAKTAAREAKAAAREAEVRGTPVPPADAVPPLSGVTPVPAAAPTAPARRGRVLPVLFGLVLVAALAGIAYGAWVLFRTPTHEVPDLTGLAEDEVISEVQDFNWDIDFDTGRSDDVGVGEVFRTSPEAGKELAEGSPLVVYVSAGPEFRQLPDLAGSTLEEAQAALEELRLVPGTPTEEFSETAPAGTVISYGVAGDVTPQGVLPGTTVELVLSKGPQPRTVPSLVGLDPDAATRLLEQFGLTLELGEPVFSNDIDAGLIATQTPASGELLDRGAAVTAAPSKGPDLVTVPDLTGMTLAEALQALSDAGLQGSLVLGSSQGTFYSATVGDQPVAAGDQVLRGSVVNLLMF